MNRYRRTKKSQKLSIIGVISLVLGLGLGGFGGFIYVFFRNEQIRTAREIDLTEQRIQQHLLDIRTMEMRSDQILNLFAIRTTLKEAGSTLKPIPMGVTEEIRPYTAPATIAARSNNP